MTSITTNLASHQAGSTPRTLHISLWITQVFLAFVFTYLGVVKLTLPMTNPVAEVLVRLVGISELLSVLCLIIPPALRIRPILTPVAATWLFLIMVLAAGFHVYRAEFEAIPLNLLFGAPAAFVAWGRFGKARVQPRP
jgi:putative oxidoreductase